MSTSSRYSGFIPFPIHFPSSSKKATQPHHLWIRPHTPSKSSRSSKSSPSDDLPAGRTLFIANLPIDIEERELRSLFGEWGVVERVVFKLAETGQAEDPWAEDSDSDDEMDDASSSSDEASAAPTDSKKPKKGKTGPKAPQVTPLPPLNPRSLPLLPANSSAYLIYLDALSLARCLSLSPTRPAPTLPSSSSPKGLAYYRALHESLRPSLEVVKAHADSSLALFDYHQNLSSARAAKGAIVDDDGFTLVVRGGKYGRTAGKGASGVGVASRRFQLDIKKAKAAGLDAVDAREGLERGKERKKTKELDGFYKFQRNERKRQDLADLRKNFEADREKVMNMKAQRKFKPY